MMVLTSLMVAVAVGLFVGSESYLHIPLWRSFGRYRNWWTGIVTTARLSPGFTPVPWIQLLALGVTGLLVWLTGELLCLLLIGLVVLLPPWMLHRAHRLFREDLESQLPGFLIALADALTAIPNLGQALRSTAEHAASPMRQEIEAVIAETRLGRSLDQALENLARRLRIPGVESAVSAALLGRRTGGDLCRILRRIATSLREIARLEGVIRVKTSEGRNQALVMGSMPPVLVFLLHQVDPTWLTPLWNDPIGWIIVAGAAVLEVIAILLIRKIVAVEV